MSQKIITLALATTAVLTTGIASAQSARDYISIVGSSTVYPFTTTVAEHFGKSNTQFKTPKVESTGTGGGFKLFCGGIGVQHPDITNASRKIKASEVETCAKNGVTDVVEITIGFDGIVLASSKKTKPLPLTIKALWLALAKEVPDATGKLVANPFKTWKDIDPSFPANKIEVLGPPPTSGTRDAFVELVMDHGCKEFPAVKAITDEQQAKKICQTVREDGAFIEAGENDNLIVQKLAANKNALGIFGYSFLEENQDKIQGATINGITPTFENIADGKYPVSRPLFVYAKKAHVGMIPGIKEFVAELTGEKAVGDEGYLSKKGLIPLPIAQRKQVAADANALKRMVP